MARRSRKVRISLAGSSGLQVHDRMARELPRGARVAALQVDDPYGEPGAKIIVLRSLRDDPLAGLHARKQIDEAQYIAGRHWQKAHEITEVGNLKAIDPGKEAVDGGRLPEPLSDNSSRAFADLKRALKVLGMDGEALMNDFLGRSMTIRAIAEKRGEVTENDLVYFGRRVRGCLNELAIVFGYAGKGSMPRMQ